MKRFGGWAIGIVFLVLVTMGFWVPVMMDVFFTKHYDFDEVTIEATVLQDGSLDITETRTFDFNNGPFTFAYFTVADEGFHVRDFTAEQVNADGSTSPVDLDLSGAGYSQFRAKWTFDPAEDEQRTFRFHYTYACAVDVYDDTAHLYWQFIGTDWTERTEHARIIVDIPGSADGPVGRPESCEALDGIEYEQFASPTYPQVAAYPLREGEVQAWAHGPLNGSLELADPQRVVMDVVTLPGSNFVEGSILFPADAVPFAPRGITDPEAARAALDAIVEQEEQLADEANATRERHEAQIQIARVLVIVLPLALIMLVLVSRVRDRVPGMPKDLSEPPEDDPVEASFVWRKFAGGGTMTDPQRVQLLRLVRLGAVELRTEGMVSDPKDITLHKRKEPEELSGADALFMELLFGSSEDHDAVDVISSGRPKPMAPSGVGPARYRNWMASSNGDSMQHALVRIEKSDARFESVAAFVAAGWTALFGVWSTVLGDGGGVTLWLIPYAAILLVIAIKAIRGRLDPDLRERVARLGAFRHYLLHFSSLPDAPAAGIAIWEEYMEWAVALGVADEVERQVRGLVPQQQLASSPWVPADSTAMPRFFTTMSSVAAPLTLAGSATPSTGSTSGGFGSSSSSSGGGGGFSGGGGGGGGGTGGGAG